MDGDLLSLAAELPSPLALVIAEYVEASEPYNKLHRLVDAAEVITRFLSTILLSDVADQLHAIPTDSDLGAKLASRILNPTFGHWRELAVAALGELKRHSLSAAVAELPEFWCGVWEGLLGTNKAGREDAVLPLRNHIAHLGRMTDQHAGSLLHSHQSRFEQALTKLTFLKRYDLVAISTGGEQILLRGRSRPDRPFAPYSAKVTSLSRNEVYLVGRKASLPLYPLNFFGTVLPRDLQAPSLYLRCNRGLRVLEFTALAPEASFAEYGDPVFEAFWSRFSPGEAAEPSAGQRRDTSTRRRRDAAQYDYGFDDLAAAELAGRESALRDVSKWVQAHREKGGVLWITGKPGIGKTAFMMGLRQHLGESQNLGVEVIPYFFRRGDARCSVHHFYYALALQLADYLGRDQCRDLDSVLEPKQQFQVCLDYWRRQAMGRAAAVVFLVDGLDEITGQEPDLVPRLLTTQSPGLVWVLASRNPRPASIRVDALWDDGTLPALSEDQIRAWMQRELGREKYALAARDVLQAAGSYRNPFVETVTKYSAGLPLYVHLVLEDLRQGRLSVHDDHRLPPSLPGYYEALLERYRVSDAGQLLPDILALLTWAREPLPREVILSVLWPLYRYYREPGQTLAEALQLGSTLLCSLPTPEHQAGWMLYHDSLRQYLQHSERTGDLRRRAQQLLLGWCSDSEEGMEPYAVRNYAFHLAEACEWDRLREVISLRSDHKPWAEERYALEHSYAGFLEDLELLEKHAVESGDIVLQLECLLMRASIRGVCAGLAPELLVALVRVGTPEGRWSADTVLDYIQFLDPHRRVAALTLLAEQVTDLPVQRVLAIVRYVESKDLDIGLFAALASHIPPPLPPEVVEILDTIELDHLTPGELCMLRLLRGEYTTEAPLECAFTVEDPSDRGTALCTLLPFLEGENQQLAMEAALRAAQQITYDLSVLQTHEGTKFSVPKGPLHDLLVRIKPENWHSRAEALAALDSGLVDSASDRSLQELVEHARQTVASARSQRTLILTRVLPHLDQSCAAQVTQDALQLAWTLPDELPDDVVLVLFPNYETEIHLRVVTTRGQALATLFPYCSEADQARIADHARRSVLEASNTSVSATYNETVRLMSMCAVLPQTEARGMVGRGLAAGRLVGDGEARRRLAHALQPSAPQGESMTVQDQQELELRLFSLQQGIEGDNGQSFAEDISELLPDLDEAQIGRAFSLLEEIEESEYRADSLLAFLPYLNPSLLPKALEVARGLPLEGWGFRARALASLVPHLPEQERESVVVEALAAAIMMDRSDRSREVLLELSPYREELLAPAVEAARECKSLSSLDLLEAPGLPEEVRSDVIEAAMGLAKRPDEWRYRADRLSAVVPHLARSERESVLFDLWAEYEAVGKWSGLPKSYITALADLPPSVLVNIWKQLRPMLADRLRSDLLQDLIKLTPILQSLIGPQGIAQLRGLVEAIGVWWP